MINDFDNIYKIIKLYDSAISVDEAADILEKISEDTLDIYRCRKREHYLLEKDSLLKQFSPHLGCIKSWCKTEECERCIVNKWCNHYRNNRQNDSYNQIAPTYADFFCGSGGLSLGFHMAGYKLSLANDIEECCIDTLALNHPETPGQHIIRGDINDVIADINNISRYDTVDIVIGGPPCQGFSMANRQRIIDDPRNHLYKSFIEAVSVLKPSFFVMENVRGMLSAKEQIVEDFAKIGYSSEARLLNANDFGIPQNRERVIFIGNRINIDNEQIFEEIEKASNVKPKRSLSVAIDDLPKLQAKRVKNTTEKDDELSGSTCSINHCMENSNDYINEINDGIKAQLIFNHKARYNNARDIEIYSRLNPGDNSSDPKIADIMPYNRRAKIFKDKYYKLEPDKPCKTITAHMKYDCNMYIHPYQARGLTPREAARVQSYPDWYFFSGAYTKTYMQVGNSVPPLLSKIIATVLKKYIEEV